MRRLGKHWRGHRGGDRYLEYAAHVWLARRPQLHPRMVVPMPVVLVTQGGPVLVVRGGRRVLVSVDGLVLVVVVVVVVVRGPSVMVIPCMLLGAMCVRDSMRDGKHGRREAGDQREDEDGPTGPSSSGHAGNVPPKPGDERPDTVEEEVAPVGPRRTTNAAITEVTAALAISPPGVEPGTC